MPIPTYTPGYPPDGSSLGQTKATIRNNLDGTFQTLAVDHINNNGQPGSNPAGYHTIIHEVTQTSVATISGVNQVFSGIPGALVVNSITTPAIPPTDDTQLYSLSGLGVLSQLTGSVQNTNGYQWLGSILLQWGVLASPGASGTVLFATANVNFPTNCFNVSITSRGSGAGLSAMPTKTSFNYVSAPSAAALYWIAIGN